MKLSIAPKIRYMGFRSKRDHDEAHDYQSKKTPNPKYQMPLTEPPTTDNIYKILPVSEEWAQHPRIHRRVVTAPVTIRTTVAMDVAAVATVSCISRRNFGQIGNITRENLTSLRLDC